MLIAILALLAAILVLLVLIYKRQDEVLKEVRIPTIKRASDLPDLKARLKTLPRPEGAPAPRNETPRPAGTESRPERGERRDRDNRGERRDSREPRPASEAPVAEATAPATEAVNVEAPVAAPSVQVGGRRPLTPVGTAPSHEAPVSAPALDVLAAASLAQEAPEAPIRHGRRQLPKARPNLDDVQLEDEKPAA